MSQKALSLQTLNQIVLNQKIDFEELAKVHKAVNFKKEASFAYQILSNPKNSYLAGVAAQNPDSLKFAILGVASIGLSLSPVHKLAYLLPRKNEVCLDISYRGLIQLAIDIGSIKWAQAFIVRKKDKFTLNGLDKAPTHKYEPFDDERGDIKGVYVVVKTHDGDVITHTMPIKDVYKIRDRSESWKAFLKDKSKTGSWNTDEEDMILKTCVRKASKWWPMTDTARKRFEEAIDVTNTADQVADLIELPEASNNEYVETIKNALVTLEKTEEELCKFLTTSLKRQINHISDMTEIEATKFLPMLDQWIQSKQSRDKLKKEEDVEKEVAIKELDEKLGLK